MKIFVQTHAVEYSRAEAWEQVYIVESQGRTVCADFYYFPIKQY